MKHFQNFIYPFTHINFTMFEIFPYNSNLDFFFFFFFSLLLLTGPTYLYWMERRPALYVTDPGLIKDISLCVSLDLGKPRHHQKGQEPLFGQGILKSNGPVWVHQRKKIAPEFYMDKVKVRVYLLISLPEIQGGNVGRAGPTQPTFTHRRSGPEATWHGTNPYPHRAVPCLVPTRFLAQARLGWA